MDAAEILRRVEAARSFQHQVGDCAFTVCLPTDLDMRLAVRRHLRLDNRIDFAAAHADLCAGAVTWWHGPKIGDVLPDTDAAVRALDLPFDKLLAPVYFANRLDVQDSIIEEIYKRRAARETALKNSASASPGN